MSRLAAGLGTIAIAASGFGKIKMLLMVLPIVGLITGTVYNKIKADRVEKQLILTQVQLASTKEMLKVVREREVKLTEIVARRTQRKDEWKEEALKQKNRLLEIQKTPEYKAWADSPYLGE